MKQVIRTMVSASSFRHPDAVQRTVFSTPHGDPIVVHPVVIFDKPEGLTGLAAFLADHVSNTTRSRGALVVRCWNGKSEAEQLLAQASDPDMLGVYHVNGKRFRDKAKALAVAEKVIQCFDLGKRAACINDWEFAQAFPGETAERYWKTEAARMKLMGVELVKVCSPLGGDAVYFVEE